MPAVVGDEIGGLVSAADHLRMTVEEEGGLDFPRVHVGQQRGAHPGPFARRIPVLRSREKRHVGSRAGGGFLHHIAQHVIAAVAVDQYQGLDTGAAQRVRDVPYHRVESDGGNADRARPVRVFVRTADRHRGKEVHRVPRRDRAGDRTGDQGVRRQRQAGAVLFEAADGQDGDLPREPLAPAPHVLGGVARQNAGGDGRRGTEVVHRCSFWLLHSVTSFPHVPPVLSR
ncbi:hypothetical protein SGM_2135 [Streptomyces griseoaurantiacus M045]|uniref:Uncharacterized protein n=1 Tax=Streptomyces griseoaurantiacus M045 TaxID=996637 RepID=F3NG71_9ACTN|nr:hypothetical protein SGM_2135 [Streptomyces griseoaurantiacus M045]